MGIVRVRLLFLYWNFPRDSSHRVAAFVPHMPGQHT